MREAIHDYLLDRPSGASPAELMDLVFTRPGSDPELGPRFVQSLLEVDPRFAFDPVLGRWRATVHRHLDLSLESASFVVVDLETTGGGPGRGDSIIEIGAVKVGGGRVLDEFQSLVNPGRALPRFITGLTGISDGMLAEAPPIETVLPAFAEFAGEHVLVAHNAPFDRSFLDTAWHTVLGRPVTRNFLCTLKLARRILPTVRRRGLDALAAHFGIPSVDRHRALGDARMTAEVLFRFLEALPQRGVLRVAEALDYQGMASDGRRFFCLLPRSVVSALPRDPGIYHFTGADGELLYIGKAANLHQRVSSYLSNSKGHSRKTLDLIRHIRAVSVECKGSELEAALVEAEQIRIHKPPYNVLSKHLPRVAYLKLTVAEDFPRLSIAAKPSTRRARYFGPFRGRVHAQAALDALTRAFRLRTCSGRLHPAADFAPCFDGQIGNCTIPCNGTVDAADYGEQVASFLRFFDDGDEDVFATLAGVRDRHGDRLNFESAARVQRDIDLLRYLKTRQKQMSWVIEQHHFAVVQPRNGSAALTVYLVVHGRLLTRGVVAAAGDIRALVDAVDGQLESTKPTRLLPAEVDGTTILAAWLRDRGDDDGYVIPIDGVKQDGPGRPPQWAAALEALLASDANGLAPEQLASAQSQQSHGQ